jgi:RNA polymerase sigma factor (sigma-70 family)
LEPETFSRSGSNPTTPATSYRQFLDDYLQEHSASLLGTLQSYVLRMGLAAGPMMREIAQEVFQESVVEALASIERYNPQMPLRPWFLGIAVNVIKRRKTLLARRFQREVSLGQLAGQHPELPDENAVLDALLPPEMSGPAQIVEANEEAAALLALVSAEDQQILRLVALEGHQPISLAQELHITPGAARVRLHRALSRLRAAWKAQHEEKQKGAPHA